MINFLACVRFIVKWSQIITKLGMNLEEITGFWPIYKLSNSNTIGNMPSGDHCDNGRKYPEK